MCFPAELLVHLMMGCFINPAGVVISYAACMYHVAFLKSEQVRVLNHLSPKVSSRKLWTLEYGSIQL